MSDHHEAIFAVPGAGSGGRDGMLERHKEILTLLDYIAELENYVSIIRTSEVDLVRERLNDVLQDARVSLIEILFPANPEWESDEENSSVPRWVGAAAVAFFAVVVGAVIGVRRHRVRGRNRIS